MKRKSSNYIEKIIVIISTCYITCFILSFIPQLFSFHADRFDILTTFNNHINGIFSYSLPVFILWYFPLSFWLETYFSQNKKNRKLKFLIFNAIGICFAAFFLLIFNEIVNIFHLVQSILFSYTSLVVFYKVNKFINQLKLLFQFQKREIKKKAPQM